MRLLASRAAAAVVAAQAVHLDVAVAVAASQAIKKPY